MYAHATGASISNGHSGRVAVETTMLELFAPSRPDQGNGAFSHRLDHAPLWRTDAIHRARNLAQMTTSLAVVAEHPARHWLPEHVIAQTRCLARAYEELGTECGQAELVPCAQLLVEVATRLAQIFGQARGIGVSLHVDPVDLAPAGRRAVVLMCSEMMINALKYGYRGRAGGLIRVALKYEGDGLALSVEDDGNGVVDGYSAGHGGSLLDQLGGVCGAALTRTTGSDGHGYRVRAVLPA